MELRRAPFVQTCQSVKSNSTGRSLIQVDAVDQSECTGAGSKADADMLSQSFYFRLYPLMSACTPQAVGRAGCTLYGGRG
jgi:hypothetical protein